MTRTVFRIATLAALISVSCASPPPLANGRNSAEAIATAVLAALANGDRAELERLALSEQEFKDHVWPDLPAARPERNLPFSYVWGDLHQKSNVRLSETLNRETGKRYQLRRVVFGGETSYARYVVHREASFDVIDQSGATMTLRVCGSLLEKDGVWKVFSYVVDD